MTMDLRFECGRARTHPPRSANMRPASQENFWLTADNLSVRAVSDTVRATALFLQATSRSYPTGRVISPTSISLRNT